MDKKQRLATAFIAIVGASASLNGQCDIGIPHDRTPLACEDVEDGRTLAVEATLAGTTLTIEIAHVDGNAAWDEQSVAITEPVNIVADASPSIGGGFVAVSVQLISETVTSGGLTFSGKLDDGYETSCEVTRDFTFTIDGAGVTIQ
jgi:hypothetical protein